MSGNSLRERMLQRIEDVGVTQTELARRTKTSRRNVENWLVTGVQIPAHFVASYIEAVPVDARWLLTGEGSPEPIEPSAAVEALRRIGREVDQARASGAIPFGDLTPEADP